MRIASRLIEGAFELERDASRDEWDLGKRAEFNAIVVVVVVVEFIVAVKW